MPHPLDGSFHWLSAATLTKPARAARHPPRLTPRPCERGPLTGRECKRASTVHSHVDGVPISLCQRCSVALASELDASPQPPAAWFPLDLTRPAYHLRALARGLAPVDDPKRAAALRVPVGTPAPVLDLPTAAHLLSTTPQAIHTAERREQGKGLDAAHTPGTMTVASLLARASAYGLKVEIRVRAKR